MAIRLTEPDKVLRIYYSNREIGNAEIQELFGGIGQATACKLKKRALDLMRERGVVRMGRHCVNTAVAFEAWGIDIAEIERRYAKLKKLGFLPGEDRSGATA